MNKNELLKMAYPTTLVYAVLYVAFILLCRYHVISVAFWHLPIMLLLFLIIWLLLYLYSRRSVYITSFLKTVNTNIGVSVWNVVILMASIILLVLSLVMKGVLDYCIPFFIVVAFSALVNLFAGGDKEWQIKSPTKARWNKWSQSPEKVKIKVGAQEEENKTAVEREFKWESELKSKWGIIADSKDVVKVTFFREDWEKPNMFARDKNPFYGNNDDGQPNWLFAASESNLASSVKTVLAGPDSNGDENEKNVLETIVESAINVADKYNLASYEVPELLLSFCQYAVDYVVDNESTTINQYCKDGVLEYYRFASESLYDMEGDCDCKSILACRLLSVLGMEAKLVSVCKKGVDVPSHAAVIIKDETGRYKKCSVYPEYTYCEATGEGWRIGEIDESFDSNTITMINP